jgi:hypothetical protein
MMAGVAAATVAAAVIAAAMPCRRPRKNRGGEMNEDVEQMVFSNIGEGTHGDVNGGFSKVPDVALATRYLFAKPGSDADHATLAAHTDIPYGIFQDTTSQIGGGDDLTMPVAIRAMGSASMTRLVAINSTVALGDFLVPDDGGYAKTLPSATGTYYICGRALEAGLAGDTIEMDPCLPTQRVI